MIVGLLFLHCGIGLAWADELHVLRAGERLADVAALLGVDEAQLRTSNGLGPDESPPPGTILHAPDPTGVNTPTVVLSVSGAVNLRTAAGASLPVVVGQALPTGATVCTEDNSYTTLRLASGDSHDHDEVTLLGGTCLTVESAGARAGRRSAVLSVDKGGVSVRDAGTSPGVVSVLLAGAVTSGDVGGFRVTLEPAGSARTEALTQPVAVIGAGQQIPLPAGFGSRVESGAAPSAPVALLVAPALVSPADAALLRRPDFSWTDVPSALAFRVELAGVEDFSDLLLVDTIGATGWSPDLLFLPLLPPGWWWRVCSVDRTGFVGVPSPARHVYPPVEP